MNLQDHLSLLPMIHGETMTWISNMIFFFQVIVCVLFHPASGDTFYIVTSSSSRCPGEFTGVPCLSLQQYASHPSRNENITFIVEPGSYSLSTVLMISYGNNFTMSSTNATVTCISPNARFMIDRVANVYVSGMTFQRCHTAIQMTHVTTAVLSNNRFISNQQIIYTTRDADGGCLHLISSSLVITNSIFKNNRAFNYGGAIYGLNSNITVDESEFSHNTASFGGAIYIRSSSGPLTFTINRSIISYNRASSSGTIFLAAQYNGYGSTTVLVNNSLFNYNSCDVGGAIYMSIQSYLRGNTIYNDTISINSSEFSHNTAYREGGAIYMYVYRRYGSIKAMANRSLFRNNIARHSNGGAMYVNLELKSRESINTGQSLSLIECVFGNNIAGENGGAIYMYETNGTKIEIDHNCFYNNIALVFGGALCILGTNNSINVTGTSFVNNDATIEGGGATYINGLNTNVSLSSSVFTNNSASHCGVLDVDNFKHIVNITNSVFTYNTATGQTIGGGVACIRNSSINVINSTFTHNVANYHAGVFYIDESQTAVDRSSFINNNAALDGGVFYTYIHASDYNIRRSQFSSNTAGDDGGVLFIGRLNSFVRIDESLFDFNYAADRGGVLAIIASSLNMEINRTNIYNNTAQYGGVISACNSQITFLEEGLNATVDPVLSFCMLYEGDIHDFNITLPPDPVIPSETPTTTEPVTTEQVNTRPTTMELVPMTEQVTTQPVTTNRASTQPVTTDRAAAQPVTTDRATTQPVTTDRTTKQPVTTEKATTKNFTTDSVSTKESMSTISKPSTVDIKVTTSKPVIDEKYNTVILFSLSAVSLAGTFIIGLIMFVLIAFVAWFYYTYSHKNYQVKVKNKFNKDIETKRMEKKKSEFIFKKKIETQEIKKKRSEFISDKDTKAKEIEKKEAEFIPLMYSTAYNPYSKQEEKTDKI